MFGTKSTVAITFPRMIDRVAARLPTPLWRLALWAAAFVTAFEGQLLLEGKSLGRGLVFMAVATVFIVIATWSQPLESDAEQAAGGGQGALRRRLRAAAVPLGLLFVALGLGIAFRLYLLSSQPFGIWFDEAQNGIIADRLLHDSDYRPVFITEYTGTNRPALPVYVFAAGVKLIGREILALRAVSTLAGVLTLVPLFFLARELFGLRVAALATFFLAVMRWHLNFSRLAMEPIWGPFFAVSAIFFLVRGVRGGRWYNFAASGLLLGLGLHFYWAFLLIPILFALYTAHSFLMRQSARLVPLAVGAALVALFGFLAYWPVAVYGVQHPDQYTARSKQVSITRDKDLGETIEAVVRTTRLHVLMFNSTGDHNGRHNLSGAPMLDKFTGIFFVLGLGMSLARLRQPRYFLLVAWVVVLLQPAIWSLEFEAPQALRAILVTPAVAILAALPLGALWAMAARRGRAEPERDQSSGGDRWSSWRWGRPRPKHWRYLLQGVVALAMLFFLAQTAYHNYNTYFNVQLRNPRSWMEFSGDITTVAKEMERLGPDYRILVSSLFSGPALEFVYPPAANLGQFGLDPPRDLRLGESRPTAIFLDLTKEPYFHWLRSLYPDAEFREVKPPGVGQRTVVYEVLLTPEDIDRQRGIEAIYRSQEGSVLERREPAIDFDWTSSPPVPLPFEARWSGILKVSAYGTHQLVVEAPGRLELRLDGELLAQGEGRILATRTLARGDHLLEVEATIEEPGRVSMSDNGEPIPASSYFRASPKAQGLLATFYPNRTWSGEPILEQVDPFVGFRYHAELPFGSPFSVVWRGKLDVPVAGPYPLEIQAIDEAIVSIDGQEVLSTLGRPQQEVNLTAGLHDLEVRFRNESGFAEVYLYWTRPTGAREVIPTEYLSPP